MRTNFIYALLTIYARCEPALYANHSCETPSYAGILYDPILHRPLVPPSLPLSFYFLFSASTNSFGGSCLYPCGLFSVHRHKSLHASSSVNSVFHPNSSFALVAFAVRFNTSPALRPTTSYGNLRPTALEKALIISKTVLPLPVPRFQARTPGWWERRWLRATRCPRARSRMWM